jgi:hypothetical protein
MPPSSGIDTPRKFNQDRLKAENVLSFNWRQLTSLGVSPDQARSIAITLIAKRVMYVYWRRLRRVEVPPDQARRIARSIAKYDVMEQAPTPQQQRLIQRYCPAICRAGLWRVELLLSSRAESAEAKPLQ